MSIVHAARYYRRSQTRTQGGRTGITPDRNAAYGLADASFHPHFLFNTLNAISALIHKDPAAADEMVANLSELLRRTLDTSEQEVALERELELLDRYFEIQKVRFGDQLRMKDIDPTLLGAQVPTFILQPIVENAIRHGIEPFPSPGTVRVQVRRIGESLELAVSDTGTGAKPNGPPTKSTGIGLANTEARLKELYGDSGRLFLSTTDAGCTVKIQCPIRMAAPNTHP